MTGKSSDGAPEKLRLIARGRTTVGIPVHPDFGRGTHAIAGSGG